MGSALDRFSVNFFFFFWKKTCALKTRNWLKIILKQTYFFQFFWWGGGAFSPKIMVRLEARTSNFSGRAFWQLSYRIHYMLHLYLYLIFHLLLRRIDEFFFNPSQYILKVFQMSFQVHIQVSTSSGLKNQERHSSQI